VWSGGPSTSITTWPAGTVVSEKCPAFTPYLRAAVLDYMALSRFADFEGVFALLEASSAWKGQGGAMPCERYEDGEPDGRSFLQDRRTLYPPVGASGRELHLALLPTRTSSSHARASR
jgi:hypothetical protein